MHIVYIASLISQSYWCCIQNTFLFSIFMCPSWVVFLLFQLLLLIGLMILHELIIYDLISSLVEFWIINLFICLFRKILLKRRETNFFVFNTSSRRICNTSSWRCIEGIFKNSKWSLEDVLKIYSAKHFLTFEDVFQRCLQDVLGKKKC